VRTTRSGITFIRYAQNRKTGKLNVLGAIKRKGLNTLQDIQSRLRSPIPVGGEP